MEDIRKWTQQSHDPEMCVFAEPVCELDCNTNQYCHVITSGRRYFLFNIVLNLFVGCIDHEQVLRLLQD